MTHLSDVVVDWCV